MSRSYRAPYFVGSYGSKVKKLAKRNANKAVRKETSLSDGKMYRKVFCSWDICDFKIYSPKERKARAK